MSHQGTDRDGSGAAFVLYASPGDPAAELLRARLLAVAGEIGRSPRIRAIDVARFPGEVTRALVLVSPTAVLEVDGRERARVAGLRSMRAIRRTLGPHLGTARSMEAATAGARLAQRNSRASRTVTVP